MFLLAVYQIDYDLKSPGQEYEGLYGSIKSLGNYCHILESKWLVDVDDMKASEIRNILQNEVDSDDNLIVTKFDGGCATNFSNDCTDWLHEHL